MVYSKTYHMTLNTDLIKSCSIYMKHIRYGEYLLTNKLNL